MAKRDNKKKLTRSQLWRLWSHVGVSGWQELLDTYKPTHRFVPIAPGVLKGKCIHPDHNDTSPSAFFHIDRGFYKCHGGHCEYFESNMLLLVAFARGCTYGEAFRYTIDTWHPPFISAKAQSAIDAEVKNQRIKQEIVAATHDSMCLALSNPHDSAYASLRHGLDWLINVRKIPESVLHMLPVGLMPELSRLGVLLLDRQKQQDLAWHNSQQGGANKITSRPLAVAEAAQEYMARALQDPDFVGSVTFPLHVSPTDVGRIKLRVPASEKKFIMPDDDFEDLFGLYGPGWSMNRDVFGADNKNNPVYLVEGEMDALSIWAHYAVNGKVDFPVFSVGGKGGTNYIEPILRAMSVSRAYLVGDAPAKQGDELVQGWLENIHEIPTRVFTGWGEFQGSGDLDEALLDHGYSKVKRIFLEEQEDHFMRPWEWAVARVKEELSQCEDGDFRTQIESASVHGRYLLHRLDQTKFIEIIADAFDLNPLVLKREIQAGDHTEIGFMQSCTEAIRELFEVLGIQKTEKGRQLVLYSRKDKTFQTVQLASPRDLESLLAGVCGSLISFVRDFVGIPPFLEYPDPSEPNKKVVGTLTKDLKVYVTNALSDLAQGAPDLGQSRRYSQGYHRVDVDGLKEEFVVCGKKIFHIDRTTGFPVFEQLPGPAYKSILFDTGIDSADKGREWYPGGVTSETLSSAQNIDMNALYDDLVHLYSTAFRFKNHAITAELFAALLMSIPTMSALSRPVLTFITGDSSSGKTTLLSTIAQIGPPEQRLLYTSVGHQSYSPAGVGRIADGMSCALALDEFESGDNDRGRIINKIFEMFRGLITGETDRVIAQGSTGTKREYYRLPLFFAAIRGAERPQDLNRVLQIETERVPNKINPGHVIRQEFTKERIAEMAEGLSLGMFSRALELAKHEADFISKLPDIQQELGVKLEWRFASNLFAPLSVMKLLGRDWKGFLKSYVLANVHEITRVTTTSETESLLAAILYAANVTVDPREPKVSIARLLVSEEQRDFINASGIGVFYDDINKHLLIHADQGAALVPQHLRARNMTGPFVKGLLDRHPAALKPEHIVNSGIMKRIVPALGAGIRLQDVIVFDASRWLDGSESAYIIEEENLYASSTDNEHSSPGVQQIPIQKEATTDQEAIVTPQAEKPEEVPEETKDDDGSSDFEW